MPIVNIQKCPKNHVCPCVDLCPVGAISQEEDFSDIKVDNEKCIKCGTCVQNCPHGVFQKPAQ